MSYPSVLPKFTLSFNFSQFRATVALFLVALLTVSMSITSVHADDHEPEPGELVWAEGEFNLATGAPEVQYLLINGIPGALLDQWGYEPAELSFNIVDIDPEGDDGEVYDETFTLTQGSTNMVIDLLPDTSYMLTVTAEEDAEPVDIFTYTLNYHLDATDLDPFRAVIAFVQNFSEDPGDVLAVKFETAEFEDEGLLLANATRHSQAHTDQDALFFFHGTDPDYNLFEIDDVEDGFVASATLYFFGVESTPHTISTLGVTPDPEDFSAFNPIPELTALEITEDTQVVAVLTGYGSFPEEGPVDEGEEEGEEESEPTTSTATLSSSSVVAGSSVSISGSGFGANETNITVRLTGPGSATTSVNLATNVTANASGSVADQSVTIPSATAAGTYTLALVGNDHIASATLSVTSPASSTATLSSSSVAAGGQVTISSNGFNASEQDIDIELRSDPVNLGTTSANASGFATATVTIPANTAPGTHTLALVGADFEATASITITAAATGEEDSSTPSDVSDAGWASIPAWIFVILLLGVGLAALPLLRRFIK